MDSIVTPSPPPTHDPDELLMLVGAITRELWIRCGRDATLNWTDIELQLAHIVAQARADAQAAGGTPSTGL